MFELKIKTFHEYWIGLITGLLIALALILIFVDFSHKTTLNIKNSDKAYSQYTGNNITGIYFPKPTMCIYLDNRNQEQIEDTIHHEYLHHLIIQNKTYKNVSAYEHFCGDQSNDI